MRILLSVSDSMALSEYLLNAHFNQSINQSIKSVKLYLKKVTLYCHFKVNDKKQNENLKEPHKRVF